MKEAMNVLRVGARSDPRKVAGALADTIREHGWAETRTIGAAALNQTVKAIAIARGYLAPQGLDILFAPSFSVAVIDGKERTVINLFVEPRDPAMRTTDLLPPRAAREGKL